MNENDPSKDEEITVAVILSGDALTKFKASSEASGRSFRQEAKLRLIDHLEQYVAIAALGNRTTRK